ncbi:hypothetical protein [Streptomyces sp. SID10815]|uniref:hypothetical protein n=1 Tax=Streptomyces sp. SID10815 TaxID=2706027 RepID=UPI0013CD2280|nr:hypothetical protein [Streptomyces sp. SID10815]NEA45490.1 hypothetical protein [Streptomyces sp. SID10815]
MDAADPEDDLRRLLNEWDPIGVADLVQDEYDCLITPLLDRLKREAGRTELREFLSHELTDHFGLDHPYDVDGMADRLTVWWTSTHPQI